MVKRVLRIAGLVSGLGRCEMLQGKGIRVAIAVLVLLLGVCVSGRSAKRVFIDSISGYDSELVNLAATHLPPWIRSLGHSTVGTGAHAAYLVRFAIVRVTPASHFNWRILPFPLCPIVPFTTPETDVVLSLAVRTVDGRDVFTNQAGGSASAFWFGDFVSQASLKKAAFEQAFRVLTVTAHLP